MKNLDEIKGRFFKEPFHRRLGHLASDLLRISSFLDNPKNEEAVVDMIEESKFFIEWAAPEAPSHIQEFFADIQPKLALWQQRLVNGRDVAVTKEALRNCAKNWSGTLIRYSGLLVT
jgi:hypothetical protein